jgi:DNA-binding NarL/FixJ family response regulator
MPKLRTFFVEDNPTIRAQLIATLADLANVECVGFADNESEAIAWLHAHTDAWDVALVDLFLKQGSGMGVVASVADRRGDKKVIVVSNYATRDVSRRCREIGCDGVFDKSSDVEALVEF